MFTGIVEELGHVRDVRAVGDGIRLEITATRVLEDATIGASIAVNGCCLTVVERGDDWWAADVQVESMRRTCLPSLVVGDAVNLERPVRLSDRLGGHIVQGHVDTTGTIVERTPVADGSVRMRLRAPAEVLRYVIEKGSVAVDGVSLTVAEVHADGFSVALVPHTLEVTTLGRKDAGSPVNLEPDMIAKYVATYVERIGAPAFSPGG
jgi:riboflavin synthase